METMIIYSNLTEFDDFIFLNPSENFTSFGLYKLCGGGRRREYLKNIIRACTYLKVPTNLFWGKWKFIKDAKLIILLVPSLEIMNCIDENNGNSTRKILYLWNPHIHDNILYYALKNNWEVWTFDKQYAKENDFAYNPQFYPMYKSFHYDKKKQTNDFLFIGYNKGRISLLREMQNEFRKYGLSSFINIREWNKYSIIRFRDKYVDDMCITYKEMKYSEIINWILSSKCLIEIVQQGQTGLTMRAMEALCFKKKLLTNNKSIRFEKMYDKNNIFIWGEDDVMTLSSFINSEYKEIEDEIIEEYDMKKWFFRF